MWLNLVWSAPPSPRIYIWSVLFAIANTSPKLMALLKPISSKIANPISFISPPRLSLSFEGGGKRSFYCRRVLVPHTDIVRNGLHCFRIAEGVSLAMNFLLAPLMVSSLFLYNPAGWPRRMFFKQNNAAKGARYLCPPPPRRI